MDYMFKDISQLDKRYYELVSFGLVFSTINGIARYFAFLFLNNALIGSYLTLIVWCLLLGAFLTRNWKMIGNRICLGMIAYVSFIVIMFIFFPLSRKWIGYYANDLMIYLLVGIPMFVLVKRIVKWEYLLSASTNIFRITAIFAIFTYLLSGGSFFTPMEWGNRIVPITLCYIVFASYKKNKIDYPILILLICVSLLGGRQSFAIIVVAVFVSLFFTNSTSKFWLIFKILVTFILASCVVFLNRILEIVSAILIRFGIYARSLDKLTTGFFEDSGRTLIYQGCRKIIAENGVSVNGIFSDHYYITNLQLGKNYTFAHNFIYEILIDFGIIIGGIFIFWLFFILVRRTIECKSEYKCLFFIFLLYGMGRIMVSSSVFIYFNFVIMLGFLFNEYIYIRRFRRFVIGKRY